MKVVFSKKAHKDFSSFKATSSHEYIRIKNLITSIIETPYDGLGMPKPLKGDLKGWYSRRITKKDRLVYKLEGDRLTILSCRYHY